MTKAIKWREVTSDRGTDSTLKHLVSLTGKNVSRGIFFFGRNYSSLGDRTRIASGVINVFVEYLFRLSQSPRKRCILLPRTPPPGRRGAPVAADHPLGGEGGEGEEQTEHCDVERALQVVHDEGLDGRLRAELVRSLFLGSGT